MFSKFSKTLLAAAVVLLLASLVFAGGQADKGGKKLNIVFVTPLIAHPVWDVARAGFEDAAKRLDFNAQYVGPQGIEWMNRSARRMFGGDLADFVGQPLSTVATSDIDHPFRITDYLDHLRTGAQAIALEPRVA